MILVQPTSSLQSIFFHTSNFVPVQAALIRHCMLLLVQVSGRYPYNVSIIRIQIEFIARVL